MKFGFITCVQLGLSCMEAIYEVGGRLDLALTLPDDIAVHKSGRVYLDPFCSRHVIPLIKIRHLNSPKAVSILQAADLDWLFIIGWSQIASSEILAIPHQGVLGMHPTLLPIGRGRASIPWAILLNLAETGVTLFRLEVSVDTGPIAKQIRVPMSHTTTATELYDKVALAHALLMRDVFPKLEDGSVVMVPQDETQATTWPERRPEDGQIDLNGSVWSAERLVRATTKPYPGAFFTDRGSKTIVWSAGVRLAQPQGHFLTFRDGFLELLEIEIVT